MNGIRGQLVAGIIMLFLGCMIASYPYVFQRGTALFYVAVDPTWYYEIEMRQNDSWSRQVRAWSVNVPMEKAGGSVRVNLQYLTRYREEDRNWLETHLIEVTVSPNVVTYRDLNNDKLIGHREDVNVVDVSIRTYRPEPKTYTFSPRTWLISGDYRRDWTWTPHDWLTLKTKVLKSPTVDFTWEPANVTTQTYVTFRANITKGDGDIINVLWDFDNNGSWDASGDTVVKVFPTTGVYWVKVEVTDSKGITATSPLKAVNVRPPELDPVITKVYTDPPRPVNGMFVSIICEAYDPDGWITGYKWKVSKGDRVLQETDWQTGNVLPYSFPDQGTYTIEVTVKDDKNRTCYVKVYVDVLAYQPPLADFILPRRAWVGATVTLTDNSLYSAPIENRVWTVGGRVLPDNGRVVSFVCENKGILPITLTITDALDQTSSAYKMLVIYEAIPNDPPVVDFSVMPYMPEIPIGTPLSFTNYSYDPDGDKITCKWDFGDNTTSEEFHPAKVYTEEGYYTVRLLVTDEVGASTSKSIILNVIRPRYTVTGFVYDKKTGEKLSNVLITISSSELGEYRLTFTDVNGFYTFSDVPQGAYRVSIEKEGYITKSEYFTFKRNTQLNMVLEKPILEEIKPFLFVVAGGLLIIAGLFTIGFALITKPATRMGRGV